MEDHEVSPRQSPDSAKIIWWLVPAAPFTPHLHNEGANTWNRHILLGFQMDRVTMKTTQVQGCRLAKDSSLKKLLAGARKEHYHIFLGFL